MKKYLNSIVPFVAVIPKLFGTETKEAFRKSLVGGRVVTLPETLKLDEAEQLKELGLEETTEIKNTVPGAIEIPLQKLFDAGFKITAYLKDDTEACPDDRKESGIIVVSIQHEDTSKSFLQDCFSTKVHKVTEIEISTLNSAIVAAEVPGAFGNNYDMDKLYKAANFKLLEYKMEDEINSKIRAEKVAQYKKNPEMAEKHTKKALEKLKFKHSQFEKGIVPKETTFQDEVFKVLGEIAGIHDLKSFDELKEIPLFKAELEKSGNFADLLDRFSKLAESLPGLK